MRTRSLALVAAATLSVAVLQAPAGAGHRAPPAARVVYEATPPGEWDTELYVLDVTSGRSRRLTYDDSNDYTPTWRPPHGNPIAYVCFSESVPVRPKPAPTTCSGIRRRL